MTGNAYFLHRTLTLVAMFAVALGLTRLFDVSSSIEEHAGAPKSAERIAAMADGWTGEIAYGATYAALTPLSAEGALAGSAIFDPTDDYWGLPRSDDVDLVAAYCGACHSLAIVMQQRQSAEGWNYLLNWMTEKQGMAPLLAEDRAAILAYLTREFGDS